MTVWKGETREIYAMAPMPMQLHTMVTMSCLIATYTQFWTGGTMLWKANLCMYHRIRS